MCIIVKIHKYMNKLVIGVVALVLVGGGFFAMTASQKQEKMEMEQKAMMEKEKMEMEKKVMEEKAMMEKEAMEKEAMMKAEGTMEGDSIMKKEDSAMMKKEDEAMMKKDEAMESDSMMKKDEAAMMMKKGSYEVYSASKLALAEKGDVVLFFKASWCPTCKGLDADIKANAGSITEGVTILELNYDTETALKQKYGVTYQHTLVQVDSKGAQIAKWSGSPTLAALTSKVQ
jgi:thiol-disulfide isomerase/thioredoxin